MNIDTAKIKDWFIDKSATIVLTMLMAGLLHVCVTGFTEAHNFYVEFQSLKQNSNADILAHREIARKDSLLALYKDSMNNRMLTVEGTLGAHQEKLIELSRQLLGK